MPLSFLPQHYTFGSNYGVAHESIIYLANPDDFAALNSTRSSSNNWKSVDMMKNVSRNKSKHIDPTQHS
jgi:hypothetical protein